MNLSRIDLSCEANEVPCVSVIIAARNEERGIADCLKSLSAQTVIKEIIVVDDHSSDHTADIVNCLRKTDSKVRIIPAPVLPEGWTGKTHALHVGSQHANGDYLLFTDADVVFSGGIVRDVLLRMKKHDLDFVGGMFGIRCETIAEKISAPMLAAMGRISMSLTARRLGAGTGAFNMVRHSAYCCAGGHEAIHDHIVDDVGLARLMRKFSEHTEFDPNTAKYVQVRLFEGWTGYWCAITRSTIPFLGGKRFISFGLAIPFLLLALCLWMLPWFALKNMIYGVMTQEMPSLLYGGGQLFGYLLGAKAICLAKSYSTSGELWCLLFPLPLTIMVAAVLYITLRLSFNSTVTWRGRQYRMK